MARRGLCLLLATLAIAACAPIGAGAEEDDAKRVRGLGRVGRAGSPPAPGLPPASDPPDA